MNRKRKEDLEEVYNRKLEDSSTQKREIRRKEIEDLVVTCENNILYG